MTIPRQLLGSPIISVVQFICQVAAFGLLFTPSARRWMNRKYDAAGVFALFLPIVALIYLTTAITPSVQNAPAPPSLVEEKPPVAQSALSVPEMRYCLAQGIRIQGADKAVKTDSAVEARRTALELEGVALIRAGATEENPSVAQGAPPPSAQAASPRAFGDPLALITPQGFCAADGSHPAEAQVTAMFRKTFEVRGGGLFNFKWLRVAEMAHATTGARLLGRSVFSDIA
jgi:hypothetical protein